MNYTSGSHTVFQHRYHIVWITRYRYKVLEGALRERIRTIIRQVCKELGVQIGSGLSAFCRENMSICSWKSRRILRSATSSGASRNGHRIGCRWSSRTCASATGGGISGRAATSPPRAATSRTLSYFSIFRSTNLPGISRLLAETAAPVHGEVLPPSSPALMMAGRSSCPACAHIALTIA